ncbi:hypothetical protein MSAN_02241100 [Mycena sanguinolenta]|uniref:DUF6534 domain-containing protein n=1 Tax=Mycena sanguinolenta TaxID=230812 RepID=A0A8H7CIM5_9AGAR|nr:hypothetical protein MSAN_02241100 [Mycena sanguinolenta]
MPVVEGITLTLGALMAGALVAVGLSAIVGFQTFLYFQIFPQDTVRYKFLVAWTWLTDTAHTISYCVMIWQYAVLNFTNPAILLEILTGFPVVVVFTLIATLNANVFYAWRIHKMSKYNWWLTGTICFLCVARTALGFFVAVELRVFKTWAAVQPIKPAIVSGMAVSVATDVVISAARYYYLRDLKQGYMAVQEMVDTVVIFTINDGLLTCALLGATIACFLGMPNNFVWIALYGTAAKLYSNSVLATLNLRNWYRHRERPMGIRLTRPPPNRNMFQIDSGVSKIQSTELHELPPTMEVFMEQQVEYTAPAGKYNNEGRGIDSRP